MIRCDLDHEHETLDAALACLRVTKFGGRGSTLLSPRSPEPAPIASPSGARKGRQRKYTDNAARQRAYRERRERQPRRPVA
jgi:hypothetical protein